MARRNRVIVFNLMADDGFDSRSLGMMLERVHSMAKGYVRGGCRVSGRP